MQRISGDHQGKHTFEPRPDEAVDTVQLLDGTTMQQRVCRWCGLLEGDAYHKP